MNFIIDGSRQLETEGLSATAPRKIRFLLNNLSSFIYEFLWPLRIFRIEAPPLVRCIPYSIRKFIDESRFPRKVTGVQAVTLALDFAIAPQQA